MPAQRVRGACLGSVQVEDATSARLLLLLPLLLRDASGLGAVAGERGERGVVAGLERGVLLTECERVVLLLELKAPATQPRVVGCGSYACVPTKGKAF